MLHRLLEIEAWKSCGEGELCMMMALLLLCETCECERPVVGTLYPGQVYASVRDLATVAALSESRARTALQHLEEWGIVMRIGGNGRTPCITTILPYEEIRAGAHHPRECITVTPREDLGPAAERLYGLYLSEVAPQNKTRKRALRNLQKYLKQYTEAELAASIKAYAAAVQSRSPEYKKDPANFFGVLDPVFDSYLPGEADQNVTVAPPNKRNGTFLEQKLSIARGLYEEGGMKALRPWCERYDFDPTEVEAKIAETRV